MTPTTTKKKPAPVKKPKANKPPPPPSMPPKAEKLQEVDPNKLPASENAQRCAEIYRLERSVEIKRAAYAVAKLATKAKKGELQAAEEALAKEIHDQRFGPGPLFSPDGKSAAGGK